MEMSLRKVLSVSMVAIAFVVAGAAAAQAKDSKNIVLHYDVTIAGSHLSSGDYSVTWETHSPEATVSFLHGRKVVATAEGKVVNRGKTYSTNEVVYNVTPGGAHVIAEIRFRGSSEVIQFNE
jgi:hypothetical protein